MSSNMSLYDRRDKMALNSRSYAGNSHEYKSTTFTQNSLSGPIPTYKKYAKNVSMAWNDPSTRLKPSELSKPVIDIVADDYPMIIEFNNIKDNSCNGTCTVDIDQPIFQPSPKILVFDDYAPFAIHEKKIFFRNNDSVARRFKIIQPDSIYFEISGPKLSNGDPIKQSKIASGMEICVLVKFKPQEVKDYSVDLICSTEREKFMIPIRAVGLRPFLTIPDEIHFGNCPMKTATRKAVLVQNTGRTTAQFNIKSNNKVFSCSNEEFIVHPGSSLMIDFFFNPKVSTEVTGEFELSYSNGVKCYIEVSGFGSNVEVALSAPNALMESCYITLSTEKTIKIKNLSNLPITFSWKSFAQEFEDEAERERLLLELNRMEKLEMESLSNSDGQNSIGIPDTIDEDSDDIVSENKSGNIIGSSSFKVHAESAALVRKYRNLRQALQNDKMLFVDNIFTITPSEGSIWAYADTEVTITFRPDAAAIFNCTAYLDITGRQDRLSLQLSGRGIGPHAVLSFDILDIGDIFVNHRQSFSLDIINKGDIPASWTFLNPLTKFGNNFQFSPLEGEILPGKSQRVSISFESDILGEFSEYFRFTLQGNEDLLVCQIKGQVIGPTFHFDVSSIDLGNVSYDYLHSTVVRLVNTSAIDMDFNLHIPQDYYREFNIEPSKGVLKSGGQTDILIEFIPMSVKHYEYSLAVDVLGVGDVLLCVPIVADCIVADVSVNRSAVDFGDCCIRFPYSRTITLTNTSDKVHTKYSFLPQDQAYSAFGSYEVVPSMAVIEPSDSITVTVRLVSNQLGKQSIPFQIAIAGSDRPPAQGSLVFNCVGPKVVTDVNELKWGNIDCLVDFPKSLRITNASAISASIRMFFKMARSKYQLNRTELCLEPYESADVLVIANLDDSMVLKDELHIIVDEGENIMIPLVARGNGSTMYSATDIKLIDLGIQLTNVQIERSFILENKGRRQQFLRWTNTTVAEENKKRAAACKKANISAATSRLPVNLRPITPTFIIAPEEITLRPRTATTFTIRGNIATVGKYMESFKLESRVGKERSLKTINTSDVKVEIITPLLEFSESSMSFQYTWEQGNSDPGIQKQSITLKNSSLIPLTFTMKTELPFNLSSWEHTLNPNEITTLHVEFDALYRDDKVTHKVDKAITFSYKGHAQKDNVDLHASITFPNLDFDRHVVDFGSILNDTTKIVRIKITNTCDIPVNYEWLLIDTGTANHPTVSSLPIPPVGIKTLPNTLGQQVGRKSSAIASIGSSGGKQSNQRRRPQQPVLLDSLVDILPTHAMLQPGESHNVEFTMYGRPNSKFSCLAHCIVNGGPVYKFPVSGEASHVSYYLSDSVIDFGKVIFTEKCEKELMIINNGNITFNYSINHVTQRGEDTIEIIPSEGRVEPGQECKIQLILRPGFPIIISENISVKVAHFDTVNVLCICEGIFSAPIVNLPRYTTKVNPMGEPIQPGTEKEVWDGFQAEVYSNIRSFGMTMDTLKSSIMTSAPQFATTVQPPIVNIADDEDGEEFDLTKEFEGIRITSIREDSESSEVSSTQSMNSRKRTASVFSPRSAKREFPISIVEMEMHRIVLNKLLNARIEELTTKLGSVSATSTPLLRRINIENIVIATYHVDFGNVIQGQSKKKTFKITNASYLGQLSWTIDKKILLGTGFSIDPESMTKLKEAASTDVVVKYFARTNQSIGHKSLCLPLLIKGTPAIQLMMSANICVPDLELSSESIQFDHVYLGQSKTISLRLHNKTLVNCSWTLRKLGGKDDNRFIVSSTDGVVRPGKNFTLTIEFLPADVRRYHADLQLKVEFSKKAKTISLDGWGESAGLKFEPSVVNLGPLLPFSSLEQVVSVFNSSSIPLEFFSIDFDKEYLQEDEILANITSYDNMGLLRTQIRQPGKGLPTEIMELHKLSMSFNASTSSDGDDQSSINTFHVAPIRNTNAPRDTFDQYDLLVIGPPCSGVTTLATQIATKLNLPVKTIPELLLEASMVNGESGFFARRIFSLLSERESSELAARESEIRGAYEAAQASAIEAYKKASKKKVKDVKEVPPEYLDLPQIKEYEQFQSDGEVSVNNIAKILSYRLSFNDSGYGVIIDGLSSAQVGNVNVDVSILLSALKLTTPKISVVTMNFQAGAESYNERLSYILDAKLDKANALIDSIVFLKRSFDKYLSKARSSGEADIPYDLNSEFTQTVSMNKSADSINDSSDDSDKVVIPVAVPSGDELWCRDTGAGIAVVELDSSDMKSFNSTTKIKYFAENMYYKYSLLQAEQEAIHRLKQCVIQQPTSWESNLNNDQEGHETLETENHFTSPSFDKYQQVYTSLEKVFEMSNVEPTSEEVQNTDATKDQEDTSTASLDHRNAMPCLVKVNVNVEDSEDDVLETSLSLLPELLYPPPSKDALPEPITQQIIRRPLGRPQLKPIKLFKLLRIEDIDDDIASKPGTANSLASPSSANKKDRKKSVSSVELRPKTSDMKKQPGYYRWTVPANSSIQIKVKYSSIVEGSTQQSMIFEVCGTGQTFYLPCVGVCETPKIIVDPRNIFMKRLKNLPQGCQFSLGNTAVNVELSAPPPSKRFVLSENFYSFGPLTTFKQRDWRFIGTPTDANPNPSEEDQKLQMLTQVNGDYLRFTNNGKLKCAMELYFEDLSPELSGVFIVEPKSFELEEGESKDVNIWAFPNAVRQFTNRIIAVIENNPTPCVFPLTCFGQKPEMTFIGTWNETISAAEDALSAAQNNKKTDKKVIKELEAKVQLLKEALPVSFGKVLLGKTETRSFELRNSCMIPVAWEIDYGEVSNVLDPYGNPIVTISPSFGVIPAFGSTELISAFSSSDPMILSAKFSIKYSDAEGGLLNPSRVETQMLRVIGEAYAIKAVSLSSDKVKELQNGNEVDFGSMRVGDYVNQTIYIANRGKYRIGYRINIANKLLKNIVNISPIEGFIEPSSANSPAEVTLTFCSSEHEMVLKGNKDIHVSLFEPETNEVVEIFSLSIFANAKYNKFRLQPAKGLQFGAIRFDAGSKTKTIELRNEGNFPFSYVICPAVSEHDEIDTLDSAAYQAYAYYTPAGMRVSELGDNYMAKLSKSLLSGKAANNKLSAASKQTFVQPKSRVTSPTKGRSTMPINPTSQLKDFLKNEKSDVPYLLGNVNAYDPDNITLGNIPLDPLILGAFAIQPRVGILEPGQHLSIDIVFNPQVCDVMKEKLRFCISGVDPRDSLSQIVRIFDLSGESCYPAITTNEPRSIFEEQEVVNSLSDIIVDKHESDSAIITPKFEKLSIGKVVYAELEKLLAFGPVLCSSINSASSKSNSVVERIKITNPTKVDTTVRIQILSPEQALALGNVDSKSAVKGKGNAKPKNDKSQPDDSVSSVFSVEPAIWEIPPHEHRYVNVYFNPTEIKSYRSVFYAEVDYVNESVAQGTDSSKKIGSNGKILTFNLGGSGTLPCVVIEQPSERRSSSGQLMLDYGKVLAGKTVQHSVVIRNDGVMNATCVFDWDSKMFTIPSIGSERSLIVLAGSKQEVPVQFTSVLNREGVGSEDFLNDLKISVLNNDYSQYTISLKATAYSCDATLEVLYADDSESLFDVIPTPKIKDEIIFSELNLSSEEFLTSKQLLIQSKSAYPLKFELKLENLGSNLPEDAITIIPSMGHLSANSCKEITVTFRADKPCQLNGASLICTLNRIQFIDSNGQNIDDFTNWDNSMISERVATQDDIDMISASENAWKDYNALVASSATGSGSAAVGKLKKAASLSSKLRQEIVVPSVCPLKIGRRDELGNQMVIESVLEPPNTILSDTELENTVSQILSLPCKGLADYMKCRVEGLSENLCFPATFIYSSVKSSFTVFNLSNLQMPLSWQLDNLSMLRVPSLVVGDAPPGKLLSRNASTFGKRGSTAVLKSIAFTISPSDTIIPPNGQCTFTISFSPLDVTEFKYKLLGSSNSVQVSNLLFNLEGSSLRPVCHLDIQDSPSYLANRPSNLKNENGLYSPIEDGNIRAIEIESIGLRTQNTVKFTVINPTGNDYEYNLRGIGESCPYWRCVQSPSGMIQAGKRIEIIFEFTPEIAETVEAFYRFRIPSVDFEQVLLFAGRVREPKVSFTSAKIDFQAMYLYTNPKQTVSKKQIQTVYIENIEDSDFAFSFDRNSIMQLDGPTGPVLTISPESGIVPAHGKLPITFAFYPQEEQKYNFNLLCEVKKKVHKLSINVKGEGYVNHPQIQLEQTGVDDIYSSSETTQPFLTLRPSPAINHADFGVVQVLDSMAKQLVLSNVGRFPFDYNFDFSDVPVIGSSPVITLVGGSESGTMGKSESSTFKLSFAPNKEVTLDGSTIVLKCGRLTYTIMMTGRSVQPALKFGFMSHDFGPCFITSPGGSTIVEDAVLRLMNYDSMNNISIECLHQKTRALWVDCQPTVIEPGKVFDVIIHFAPRESKDYTFTIPFLINGASKIPVTISGRGIQAKLELVNHSQHRINFGSVSVGTEKQKSIEVVNRSRRPLPVQLIDNGGLTDHEIIVKPLVEFIVPPRKVKTIDLTFCPSIRYPTFSEDLLVHYAGLTRKLSTITGKAQGLEASLDTDSLPFGIVVLGSSKSRKLKLENPGDIPIQYNWQEETFGKHFTITPKQGKLAPGNEITFDVTFLPQFLNDDIRQEGICLAIAGMGALFLTCTGSCITQPSDTIQTLEFSSIARKADIKTVKIMNSTERDWYLTPSLKSEHWRVPQELKVASRGSTELSITYFPLTMSTPNDRHEGQVFIPLPDGNVLLYNLLGTANPPEQSGIITIETPSKKPTTTSVSLTNWLNQTQEFQVQVVLTESPSPATSIVAANIVELGPNVTKEFPLRFVSYCEGVTRGRITFTNPTTKEYMFYEIYAKAVMGEVLECISMEAPVRRSTRHVLTIENPLPNTAVVTMGGGNSLGSNPSSPLVTTKKTKGKDQPVVPATPTEIVWWTCDNKYVRVTELTSIQGNIEGSFEVEYRPLTPSMSPTDSLLTIYSKELGAFKYRLSLKALPSNSTPTLRFEVPLGSTQLEPFAFQVYNTTKSDFTCQVTKPDLFHVQSTLTCEGITGSPVDIWNGEEAKVQISFEPAIIGEIRDTLTIKSADGSEYTCELVGVCVPPMPQGPFSLKHDGSVTELTFRNCFKQTIPWTLAMDSSSFRLVGTSSNSSSAPPSGTNPSANIITLGPKSEAKISIAFDPQGDSLVVGNTITGTLLVSCPSKPEISPWIYYLRGVVETTTPPVIGITKKK